MPSPKDPNKYVGPNVYTGVVVIRNRRPTEADYRQPETGRNYEIATVWEVGIDPTTGTYGELWMLQKIVANQGYWVMLSSGVVPGGPVLTLSDTANTLVFPSLTGNIQLASINDNLTIVKDTVDTHKIVFNIVNSVVGATVTTVNVQVVDALTLDLGTSPGTYQVNCRVAAFCPTATGGPLGAGYELVGCLRTTGAAGSIIGTIDKTINEETGITAGQATIVASGNNLVVQVTGTNLKTIHWRAELVYTFVEEP